MAFKKPKKMSEMVVNNVNNKTIVLVGWSGEQENNKEFFWFLNITIYTPDGGLVRTLENVECVSNIFLYHSLSKNKNSTIGYPHQ